MKLRPGAGERVSRLGLALLRRLPDHDVVPPPDAPEWAGVAPWFDELAAYALRAISVALPTIILLAWPTDWLLYPDDPLRRRVLAEWRVVSVALLLTLALVAFRSRLARRHPMQVLTVASAVGALWSSWCNARLGSFDSPWPYFIYFAIMFASPLPCRPRDRTVLVVAVALSIVAGFCLLHPENLSHPLLPAAMLFLLVVAGCNALLGVCVWAAAVIHYFERLRLAETKESLALLNRTLDLRVREQTAELRELGRHLVRAQESERNRLAAELHDDLGQQLAAVRFIASSAQRGEPGHAPASLAEIQALVGAASASVRNLVGTLRPLLLEQLGLAAACVSLTRSMGTHAGIGHDCSVTGAFESLPHDVSVTVYRVLQEALTNVTRHAQAGAVEVELTRDAAGVRLVVRDDGRGMPTTPAPRGDGGGMGLVGMRERAHAVGGALAFGRPPGGGTELTLSIPLEGDA